MHMIYSTVLFWPTAVLYMYFRTQCLMEVKARFLVWCVPTQMACISIYCFVTSECCLFYRTDPYARSKKAIDLTAIQLNKELSGKVSMGIFVITTFAQNSISWYRNYSIYILVHLNAFIIWYFRVTGLHEAVVIILQWHYNTLYSPSVIIAVLAIVVFSNMKLHIKVYRIKSVNIVIYQATIYCV